MTDIRQGVTRAQQRLLEPDLARQEARNAGWTIAYAGLGLGWAAWCKSHENQAHAALESEAA